MHSRLAVTEMRRDDLRAELENKVVSAVLELYGLTHSQSFLAPIRNTTPQVYVVSGTREEIAALLGMVI